MFEIDFVTQVALRLREFDPTPRLLLAKHLNSSRRSISSSPYPHTVVPQSAQSVVP